MEKLIEQSLKATSDLIFRYLFGDEDSVDILLSFVNAVLAHSGFPKIVEIEIRNPFSLAKCLDEKTAILDIKAKDEQGREYDIEMQNQGDDSFKERSLFYWAKTYSAQPIKGDKHKTLRPTICINVLDFTLFPDTKKYHTCFLLKELEEGFVCTDHISFHYLELPKLTKSLESVIFKEGNYTKHPLESWLLYLKNEGAAAKTDPRTLEGLMAVPEIEKAHRKYARFTEDEEKRDLALRRLIWRMDQNSLMDSAREDGIEQGKNEKALEDAKNFKALGVSIDIICKATGLDKETAEDL